MHSIHKSMPKLLFLYSLSFFLFLNTVSIAMGQLPHSDSNAPEINFPKEAQKRISEYTDIYLVSCIKSFKEGDKIYTAGRIVKEFKGNSVPRFSVIIWESLGGNVLLGKPTREHNGDPILICFNEDRKILVASDESESLNLPENLTSQRDCIHALNQDIPPKAGLYFLPQRIDWYHVSETEIGRQMLQQLEDRSKKD